MPKIPAQVLVRTAIAVACASPLVAECSDSGFCRLPEPTRRSADAAPHVTDEPDWSASMATSTAQGAKSEDLRHMAIEATIGWRPWDSARIELSVPWVRNSGSRGTASGIGDLLVAADQRIADGGWGTLSTLVGVRLPTGDDAQLAGAPLAYQPGLGTTDFLAGVAWRHAGFDARVGYVASTGTNGTPGIELERGDDVAAGAGYSLVAGGWDLRGGLLTLVRLADSTVVAPDGGRITVEDSAGTQLNAQLGVGWTSGSGLRIGLTGAKALLSREENADVDGLTRSWSLSLAAQMAW